MIPFLKVPFFNLRMNVMRASEVMDVCRTAIKEKEKIAICFINAHCFNVAQKNEEYYKALEEAELILNDGIGIQLASRINHTKFPENLNGTDLIPEILKLSPETNTGIYFLGSTANHVEKACKNAEKKSRDYR